MVLHFKVNGHLACGHKGNNLSSSSELNRVKCRSCRNTDAYKDARKEQRNAARRAARHSRTARQGPDPVISMGHSRSTSLAPNTRSSPTCPFRAQGLNA